MEWFSNAWVWWQANQVMVLGALGALLALSMVIPGDHPDKELQWLVDMIKKFSRKPKVEEKK